MSADNHDADDRAGSGRGSGLDPLSFLFSVQKIPCFRNALLWGMSTGALLTLHRYRKTRSLLPALDLGVKTGLSMSLLTWFLCRRSFFERRDALDAMMRQQSERAANPPKSQ